MIRRFVALFDPFVIMLLGVVAAASLVPPRGMWVDVFDVAADVGIVALFFLHGSRLSREAIVAGFANWRLHLAVLCVTFALFPLLGIGIAQLSLFDAKIAAGLLFLTLLPSTVQSSIAFTAMARGNVAAALCSASFSQLVGIALTPVLVAVLMHPSGSAGNGMALGSVEKILLQLLLPFVVGHLLRPVIGGWVGRHAGLVRVVDRGSVLLVVFTAFGAAVVAGLWHQVSVREIALLMGVCAALLSIVFAATWGLGKAMALPRDEAIVLLFCGSKKSLVAGVPMAGVLFPAADVGMMILPVMLFHQIQLIACAVIARRFEAAAVKAETG